MQRDFGSREHVQRVHKRQTNRAIYELMLNVLETLQSAVKIDERISRKREAEQLIQDLTFE